MGKDHSKAMMDICDESSTLQAPQNPSAQVTPDGSACALSGPCTLRPSHLRHSQAEASVTRSILQRELGHRRARIPKQALVPSFRSREELIYKCRSVDPAPNCEIPVYAMLASRKHYDGNMLLVSDEDGQVKHIDLRATSRDLDEFTGELREPFTWRAHTNAVFDMAWLQNEEKLVTVSGDHKAGVFDIQTQTRVATLAGHHGSLKCACTSEHSPNIVVTGARDGCIMWWDVRVPSSSSQMSGPKLSPVMVQRDAHVITKKRRRSQTSIQRTHTSVTALTFLNGGMTLASAGQPDGLIKFWDQRKISKPSIIATIPPASGTQSIGYQHGVSSLSLDSTGTKLLACCANSRIYVYNCQHPENNPKTCAEIPTFSGHRNTSFYVKAVWSPDNNFILSGSNDNNAYIWEANKPGSAPFVLKGHVGDVTAVNWSHNDFGKLVTGGDDGAVRVWSLDRSSSNQQHLTRSASLFASRGMVTDRNTTNGVLRNIAPNASSSNRPAPPRPASQPRTLQHFWTKA